MKPQRKMMLALLALSVVGGCNAAPGDFCSVVTAPLDFAPVTAQAMVATDRSTVVRLAAQNAYWRVRCSARS